MAHGHEVAPLQLVKHRAKLGVRMQSPATKDSCPVCRTAEVVCGKWTLLVIRDLADGRSRFCELERSLQGISPRTLSLRLRLLEEEGIVARRTFPEVPPRVEYALTDKGRALVPLIEDMRAYGLRWLTGVSDSDDACAPEPGAAELPELAPAAA
jgi:DNA-binding HxlR family transcriptional regulator